MSSTRELRRRIKSVKSTRQITKALELVSAAKMRKASSATLASRPYAGLSWEVLRDLTNKPLDELQHPLITVRPVEKVLVFLISSDRGMAGAFNTNLVRRAMQFMQEQEALHRTVHFITMGSKVEVPLAHAGATIVQTYPHTPVHPTTADTQPISHFLTEAFINGTYDHVEVLYTEFFSMLRQDVKMKQLLPLVPPVVGQEMTDTENRPKQLSGQFFIYEPGVQQVLDYVLPRLVEVQLYQAIQESLASEHSARRMAMKSATDNASDMIDDLTLTYNSVRQSNITREIAEITSGAAALEE